MQSAERALIPYRLRTVRVGIQCTAIALALLIAFRLLPGSGPVSLPLLLGLMAVAAVGMVLALILPWQRLFESGMGLKLLYAWSVADIALISVALAVTNMHNPNLFLLYAFTTLFFAASYPVRSQMALYGLTVVSYLLVRSVVDFDESIADTWFKLGSLGLIAFLASFLSHELMQQMKQATAGRIQVEDEKRLYESLLQAQSDLGQGMAIVEVKTRRLLYVNDAMCRMFDYSRQELLNLHSLMELVLEDDHERIEQLRREREETGRPAEHHDDFRCRKKDGALITVEVASHPISETQLVALVRDVTEERRADQALRNRQELFNAASELSSGFVYSLRVDPGGALIGEWATEGYSRLSGEPRDEVSARRWIDHIIPEDIPIAEAALRRLLKGTEFIKIPLRVTRADGELRHIETYGKAVWDEERHRVIRIYGMVQDITEQRLAAAALQERSELLRAISELSSDYAYSVSIGESGRTELEWITDAVESVMGYTADELMSTKRDLDFVIHPDDRPTVRDRFRELLEGPERSRVAEIRCVRKSGEVRDIRWRARNVWDEKAGRAVRVFGSVEDITEGKKAGAALEASEERYRSLFDRLPMGLFLRTPNGRGLDANPACIEMFRYPDKETFLKTSAEEFYVDRADRQRWIRAIEAGTSIPLEVEFLRYDGTSFWGRQTARAVRDGRGEIIFYEGAIEDISERTRMEQDREASLSLLRATLESTWDGLLVVDLQGRIIEFNERFVDMWQIPREVLDDRDDERALGAVLENLKDPEHFMARVQELYRAPDEESFDNIEFKDGRVFERFSRPQRVDDRIVGRVWSFRDVTERSQLQAQLLQAQKMEAVGRLAGGVAHDFNNLLTAMLGYCELILTSSDTPEPIRRDVEEIEQAAQMGADIAAQLLDLSRRKVLRPEVLDLNEIVTSMQPMLKRLSGDDVSLNTSLSPRPCTIEADRSQIEQIILNLVVNARDAMPSGGDIQIATRNVEVSEKLASKSLQLTAGRHALLTVTDSGHGIDPAIKERIFEPFFTTRTGSRATGLGLSTVYGIISHYKGHVAVDSEPGQGTSFSVYLPESMREPIPMARARAATRWLSGKETVLLVEDDPAVRRLARRTLEKYGYSLIEAGNGSEALRLIRDHKGVIDIMITDVVMPGMDGRQLADRLLSQKPDMRVLYMSGYMGEALARFGDLRSNEDFIPKPFRPDELVAKARELLNRGSGRRAGGAAE